MKYIYTPLRLRWNSSKKSRNEDVLKKLNAITRRLETLESSVSKLSVLMEQNDYDFDDGYDDGVLDFPLFLKGQLSVFGLCGEFLSEGEVSD